MPSYLDVPKPIVQVLRRICLALPEAHEDVPWVGIRWQIRRRTFAHAFTLDDTDGPVTMMTFRSSGPELEVLRSAGHPFFRPGSGTDTVGMVLQPGRLDRQELTELLTESYCLLAPKKLVAQLDLPSLSES